MSDITIAHPPLIYVTWSCTRCGHTGGVARTTIPIETHWTEAMGRMMRAELRKKLVRVHLRGQGCFAIPEDFTIGPYTHRSNEKRIDGVVPV